MYVSIQYTSALATPCEHSGRSLGNAAFVSHQWVGKDHPDPESKQLRVLQDALQRILFLGFHFRGTLKTTEKLAILQHTGLLESSSAGT